MSTPATFQLGLMGAGLVAARDEVGALGLDRTERRNDVLRALDAGRIGLRADQDEVVIHHGVALDAKTFGHKFFFRRFGVDEHDVGIAAAGGIERLSRALCHHLHVDAGLGLEHRQDVTEQAGILRRGGGGHHDRFVLCIGAAGESETGGGCDQQAASEHLHLFSPINFLEHDLRANAFRVCPEGKPVPTLH